VNVPASGGLSLEDVRSALREFARSNNLLGLDVAQYNPDKDPDGTNAKKVVDLIVDALSARLEVPSSPAPDEGAAATRAPENAAAAAQESADVTRTSADAALAHGSEDAAIAPPSEDDVAAPDNALDAAQENTSDIAPQET
jgi:Arginase family